MVPKWQITGRIEYLRVQMNIHELSFDKLRVELNFYGSNWIFKWYKLNINVYKLNIYVYTMNIYVYKMNFYVYKMNINVHEM